MHKNRVSNNPDFKKVESDDFTLIQKEGFAKEFSKRNREIFLRLTDEIDRNGTTTASEKGMGVQKLGVRTEYDDEKIRTYLYKYSHEGKDYFVKKTPLGSRPDSGGGVEEIEGMLKVEKILRDAGIEGVECVKYIFGFTDKKNRYLVSEWNPALQHTFMYTLTDLLVNDNRELVQSLQARQREIFEVLENTDMEIYDVTQTNMAYDRERDKIILFDFKF